MKELRIGIIGMGGAGRAHARRFKRHPDVAKVSGFDLKPVPTGRVETLSNFDAFLAGVDAVSVCTPDPTHLDYITRCLEAGKHVLVEKPMVASAAEARDLRAVIDRHPDQSFAVHHQMRCVPAFQRAKALIDSGRLGDIFYVEANYWHDMRERWTKFSSWRAEGNGQSVIFGGACHPLDLILHLVDQPLDSHKTFLSRNAFSAWPGPYTAATTIMQFTNGVTAKSHASFCAVYPQFNNLIVLGDRGSYVDGLLFIDGRFVDTNSLNPLTRVIARVARCTPLFRANPFSVYEHEHACRAIIDNFVESIVHDAPVLVGIEDGARVVMLCEEAERDGLASLGAEQRAARLKAA